MNEIDPHSYSLFQCSKYDFKACLTYGNRNENKDELWYHVT